MSTPNYPLPIDQGATFDVIFNWYGAGKFMAPIEEIIVGYPTIIKVTAHGLPQVSDTPVIISGVDGADILNSTDLGIEEAKYIDADHFSMPINTVKDCWDVGSGEITYHMPSDLTNYTARMHIREKWHSKTFIHEATTENGGITLRAADGAIMVTITAADTTLFTFNKAVYDIELIDGAGAIVRAVEGTFTLNKEVTK